ncbi:MAG: PDC sensor domain-containing protein, partial [Deltaproteobacteria bacterium]|nr:PDC sensor domain-containing protein [Deltaproteobacteria bacterium]
MQNKLSSLGLKPRIIGTALLLFLISMWLMTYLVQRHLENDMIELLGAQQFSAVSYIASEIEEKIRFNIEIVSKYAVNMTPELLADPIKAREYLSQRYGLLASFKAGLIIISAEGDGITDYPPIPDRAHASYRELEYFKDVVATRRTTIGKPSIGRFTKAPGVAIAAPIIDKSGKLIGVLAGFATLSDSTLFGQVEKAYTGNTGYALINAPRYGLI